MVGERRSSTAWWSEEDTAYGRRGLIRNFDDRDIVCTIAPLYTVQNPAQARRGAKFRVGAMIVSPAGTLMEGQNSCMR